MADVEIAKARPYGQPLIGRRRAERGNGSFTV